MYILQLLGEIAINFTGPSSPFWSLLFSCVSMLFSLKYYYFALIRTWLAIWDWLGLPHKLLISYSFNISKAVQWVRLSHVSLLVTQTEGDSILTKAETGRGNMMNQSRLFFRSTLKPLMFTFHWSKQITHTCFM